MTVRQIAERAGVSAATVSRFLRDPEAVSEQSRALLRETLSACAEDDRPRRRPKQACVAVLLPHLKYQFYQCALRELVEQAPAMGLRLVILPEPPGGGEGLRDMLEQLSPCALLSLEAALTAPAEAWLKAHPAVRVAMLAEKTLTERAYMVHINDLAAAYEGTRYLLSLGHRRIRFLSNQPRGISTSFQRLTGSQKAMHEIGLAFSENVRYGTLTYDVGYALAEKLAQTERGAFTAIFAYSDEMAVGAIMALRDHGLRVPEDVSVLGIDDLPIASAVRPALTTIHQPLPDMARCALELLTGQDVGGRAVVLPHRLIKRGTCRAITEGEP